MLVQCCREIAQLLRQMLLYFKFIQPASKRKTLIQNNSAFCNLQTKIFAYIFFNDIFCFAFLDWPDVSIPMILLWTREVLFYVEIVAFKMSFYVWIHTFFSVWCLQQHEPWHCFAIVFSPCVYVRTCVPIGWYLLYTSWNKLDCIWRDVRHPVFLIKDVYGQLRPLAQTCTVTS